jgi:hypothetical protein
MHDSHYQPRRSEQLVLVDLYKQRYGVRSKDEQIVVHHVLEDTPSNLHLQIERRSPEYGIDFFRVYL